MQRPISHPLAGGQMMQNQMMPPGPNPVQLPHFDDGNTFRPLPQVIPERGGTNINVPAAQDLQIQAGQIPPRQIQDLQIQSGQMQPQVIPQPPQQQFGLSGAEQALRAGTQAGVSALSQGQNQALNTLQFGNQFAQDQLQQGVNALGGDFSASAASVDPMTGRPMFQQAAEGVGAFSPAGLQAQGLQSALSGAQGQEAFNQALLNSPVQQFLREQGERAVVNQATATGGLGGGEVLRELTQFGQGLAGTQLQQQIANLQNLSGQGLQAAGQRGQFLSQAGQQQGQLAGQNAQLATQANLASARNSLAAAQQKAGLFGQGAGIGANLAGQGAGMQFGAGQNVANLLSGAGGDIAGMRFQTGRDMASQIGQSASALSKLAEQQGSGLSDIIGGGSSNLANLISGSGQFDANQQAQLGQILANLSVGAGSNAAGLQSEVGKAEFGAQMAAKEDKQQTIGAIAGIVASMFSDERLKDNVELIGKQGDYNVYSWTYNDDIPDKSLVGVRAVGVMAGEVEKINPSAVTKHESGYKMVNYNELGL